MNAGIACKGGFMFTVKTTKIVKDSNGNVTHEIPFEKTVLIRDELRPRSGESAQDYLTRIMAVNDAIDQQLSRYGWDGSAIHLTDASENGDGSIWEQVNKNESPDKSLTIDGPEACLNMGIDLAIRAALQPPKPGVKANRECCKRWIAKQSKTDEGRKVMEGYLAADLADSYLDGLVKSLGTKIPGVTV